MSNKSLLALLVITFLMISFLSCAKDRNESDNQTVETIELPSDGIEIRGAWARAGRVNGVSAIYMNVLNGSAETDSLLSLSSPVAGMVEVHESYEREEGLMGMRQATSVVFPGRDAVVLEPGGMHVMLMQLNKELSENDEVELTIQFANAGELTITAPVGSME